MAALGTLLLGTYLPWVAVNPRHETRLLIGIAGMGSGLEIYGLLILPLTVVALVGMGLELP
ncbi:hypothetical protein C483_18728 [Natrialba hulunbeirensis JCM 10989]|uniref:Uncharacterized protein n=1 Tax=Natrialba hulunbeirensis JCM 10989 TaxID=1227493 RepID=L9ZQB7_9EURY|nr:hypothetical protein C483_18728 [Natrialba hulunbeirensis JCM 10989]